MAKIILTKPAEAKIRQAQPYSEWCLSERGKDEARRTREAVSKSIGQIFPLALGLRTSTDMAAVQTGVIVAGLEVSEEVVEDRSLFGASFLDDDKSKDMDNGVLGPVQAELERLIRLESEDWALFVVCSLRMANGLMQQRYGINDRSLARAGSFQIIEVAIPNEQLELGQ